MEEPNELKLISTDDLIKEILARCSPACFIGTRVDGHKNNVNFWEINGHPAVCYGMLHELALTIQLSEIEKRINTA